MYNVEKVEKVGSFRWVATAVWLFKTQRKDKKRER